MSTTQTRKWTAQVSVAGQDVTSLVRLTHDTLHETAGAAKAVAADLILNGEGSDAAVILFKQLKGDEEPKRDRAWYMYLDDDGRVRSQEGA
jgi:Flp pilus assembly protein CpaB